MSMTQQWIAFIVIASFASGSANATSDVSIKNRLDAIGIADKFCGDLGKSFSKFPWHAKLNGRTWKMWKADDGGGTLWADIDAVTGKSGDCGYTPCGRTQIRTVCSGKFGQSGAN